MLSVIPPTGVVDTARLAADLREARARTLELIDGLDDGQLIGLRLAIVTPMLREIGHVAWFDEHFILQRMHGHPPLEQFTTFHEDMHDEAFTWTRHTYRDVFAGFCTCAR